MALPPLATIDDLADRLPQPPANMARADAALADASAAVRAYTGQEITERTSTARLKVVAPGVLRLPQAPVTDVDDVTGRDGVTVTWQLIVQTIEVWAPNGTYLDVTYTHGYAEVPDDIVAVVCNIAGRAIFTGPETAGLTQESITNYSASYGPVTAAGPVGLFDAEKMVLDRYRLPVGPVWVAS